MLEPLDVIELRVAVDGWQAGTIATVLEVKPGSVLAEVADEDGRTLDLVTVPDGAAQRAEQGNVRKRPKMSEDVQGRPGTSHRVPAPAASRRSRGR